MVEPNSGAVEGLAGQRIFYRKKRAEEEEKKGGKKKGRKNDGEEKKPKKPHSNTRRRSPDRESAVWGNLMDDIGQPPPGVCWVHVCDRGADDFEVFCRALHNQCDFVIRATVREEMIGPPLIGIIYSGW